MTATRGERLRQLGDDARRNVAAAGGLLLSLSMFGVQIGDRPLKWSALLYASWGALGTSVVLSLFLGLLMIRWADIDKNYAEYKVRWNLLQVGLLVLGLALLLTFAALNVRTPQPPQFGSR